MRFNFSREIHYIPEWNGNRDLPVQDQIRAKIKPMVVADLIRLMDVIGTADKVDGAKSQDIVNQCGDMLPKYVIVENLTDDNGPVSLDDLLNYAAYLGLAGELLMHCASVSMPSASAQGNLKAQ